MELYYRKLGNGPPLIILHGLFGMSDNWLSIASRIAERHTVYIPDQRNHGRSPNNDRFNYQVLVDDLMQFMNLHSLNSVRLIGHSMGGKVAMQAAIKYPEKFTKLVVVDIAPKKYATHFFKSLLEQLTKINLDRVKSYSEVNEQMALKISSPLIRQFVLKNLYRDEQHNFRWRIDLNSINNNIDSIVDSSVYGGVYEDDTLFIRGGESEYVLDSDMPNIKTIFPNAQVYTIPLATHWVHSDAPDDLCAVLGDFLHDA